MNDTEKKRIKREREKYVQDEITLEEYEKTVSEILRDDGGRPVFEGQEAL